MSIYGKRILHFDTVTSTFDKLLEYPPENGLTVVADRQTGGIGRNGRAWLSADGGLYFSFYIIPDGDVTEIPFIAILCALAAYRTISRYTSCGIKWPNDIVKDGKKICGILTKSSFGGDNSVYVMAGIGINVNNSDFGELDYRADSLKNISGTEYDREVILKEFLADFEYIFFNLTKEQIIEQYSGVCVTVGEKVAVHYNTDGTVFEGRCIRVCTDGTLDIETDGGIVNVNSGEVSVRGVYGYV